MGIPVRWTHVPQAESQTQSSAEVPVLVRDGHYNRHRQLAPGITRRVSKAAGHRKPPAKCAAKELLYTKRISFFWNEFC